MTERKPPGASVPSWVEMQVQAALERGDLDDLPLAGRPLPQIERPRGDYDYVVEVAEREGMDPVSFLPPSLAMLRELEQLPDELDALTSEADVRQTVTDVNRRIRDLLLMPREGPPLRARPLDVEEVVAAWRARRPAAPVAHAPQAPTPPTARRPWWRWRRG